MPATTFKTHKMILPVTSATLNGGSPPFATFATVCAPAFRTSHDVSTLFGVQSIKIRTDAAVHATKNALKSRKAKAGGLRGRSVNATHKHAVAQRKRGWAKIKFNRTEVTKKDGPQHISDEDGPKFVKFTDFNLPTLTLESSLRLRELIQLNDVDMESSRKDSFVADKGEGETVEELIKQFGVVDTFIAGSEQQTHITPPPPRPHRSVFSSLMASVEKGGSKPVPGAVRTAIAQAAPAPPPVRADLYKEGVTNVYWHPGMTVHQASTQSLMTMKAAHGAATLWATEWSTEQFLAFARDPKSAFQAFCRDINWMAQFFHLGRAGWDLRSWHGSFFADAKGWMCGMKEVVRRLAGKKDCEFLGERVVVHLEAIENCLRKIELAKIAAGRKKRMGEPVKRVQEDADVTMSG